MKPSWDDAPEWANYLAMDADGKWYWFELRPVMCASTYDWGGRFANAGYSDTKWSNTLEQRPSN